MASPKAQTRASPMTISAARTGGGDITSPTSKPRWSLSRTPTAAPSRMNQDIRKSDPASTQIGVSLST
jgi:hypothetical protein